MVVKVVVIGPAGGHGRGAQLGAGRPEKHDDFRKHLTPAALCDRLPAILQ